MPRRPRTPLFGPLGGWELVRLARKGHGHRARSLVLYFVLIGFALTPILWFPHARTQDLFLGTGTTLGIRESAAFANSVAVVLLEAMLLAVAVMTPGYAATAVAEEKERDTLTVLLTTALTDREIVLGKAVGRGGFVLSAAAAGVPALALVTLYGGVDPLFLLAGLGLVTSTAVLATAIGVHAGCAASDVRGALLRAYGGAVVLIAGLFIPPVVFFSPFAVLIMLAQTSSNQGLFAGLAVGYPAAQLLIACGFLFAGVRRVRDGGGPRPLPTTVRRPGNRRVPVARPVAESEPRPARQSHASHVPNLPRVSDRDPLLWKERYVTGRKAGSTGSPVAVLAKVGFGLVAVILVASGALRLAGRVRTELALDAAYARKPLSPSSDAVGGVVGAAGARVREGWRRPVRMWAPPDGAARALMTGGVLMTGLYLVPAAIALAPAVARERHRKTLDALLCIPVDRRDVLRAKVRAAVERGWPWAPVAVLALAGGFAAEGGPPLGLTAGLFVLAGGWFVVWLGVWLTVRCPSEVQALRFLVPAVVLVVGGPVGVWNSIDWRFPVVPVVTMAASAAGFAVAGTVLRRQAARALGAITEHQDRAS